MALRKRKTGRVVPLSATDEHVVLHTPGLRARKDERVMVSGRLLQQNRSGRASASGGPSASASAAGSPANSSRALSRAPSRNGRASPQQLKQLPSKSVRLPSR